MNKLIDDYKRRINYLRISITDRCNLRCAYCMSPEGISPIDHQDILSYEEIVRIAQIAVSEGITKIRITGGEPLVRKGAVNLIEWLSKIEGITDLSMTTNGILLGDYAQPLFDAGLKRVNISMDSLNPDLFREITRGGDLSLVWKGIEKATQVGLNPIKINVVAIQGYLSCSSIRTLIEKSFTLDPVISGEQGNSGPAEMSRIKGAQGMLGFINAVSNHFCARCNRLRLTADGKLRPCLFSDEEIDIKDALRSRATDEEVRLLLHQALLSKPKGHTISEPSFRKCARDMVAIGG